MIRRSVHPSGGGCRSVLRAVRRTSDSMKESPRSRMTVMNSFTERLGSWERGLRCSAVVMPTEAKRLEWCRSDSGRLSRNDSMLDGSKAGFDASSGFCTAVIRSCDDTERYGTARPDDCGVVAQAGGAESGGCDAAVRTGGVDVGIRVIRFRTGALGGGGTWGVEGPRPEVDDARIGGDTAAVGDFPREADSE